MVKDYASNVFLNCPFDDDLLEIRDAILFAILDCGFIPRCALEEVTYNDYCNFVSEWLQELD